MPGMLRMKIVREISRVVETDRIKGPEHLRLVGFSAYLAGVKPGNCGVVWGRACGGCGAEPNCYRGRPIARNTGLLRRFQCSLGEVSRYFLFFRPPFIAGTLSLTLLVDSNSRTCVSTLELLLISASISPTFKAPHWPITTHGSQIINDNIQAAFTVAEIAVQTSCLSFDPGRCVCRHKVCLATWWRKVR